MYHMKVCISRVLTSIEMVQGFIYSLTFHFFTNSRKYWVSPFFYSVWLFTLLCRMIWLCLHCTLWSSPRTSLSSCEVINHQSYTNSLSWCKTGKQSGSNMVTLFPVSFSPCGPLIPNVNAVSYNINSIPQGRLWKLVEQNSHPVSWQYFIAEPLIFQRSTLY